jgi:N-methylhydantoinase A
LLREYLDTIDRTLRKIGFGGAFYPMLSSGGTASVLTASAVPIQLVESGPAAGATAAAYFGELHGERHLISFDMGGTTAKICLIQDSRPTIAPSMEVARVARFMRGSGIPLQIPTVEMLEIGAGGGSIAWVDSLDLMKVGPRSAGAEPGPMCYPHGGDEPTITDANLVMGRIPAALIGGGIPLDRERARSGLAALAARLPGDMSAEALAEGIIEIANWNQANAIRQMTIQRGIDPRQFALMAFGGSGPAQSPAVMELIGMKACIVPPNPGNLSAFGLLAVDWRTDQIVTKVMHEDAIEISAVADIYAGLERAAATTLERDGIEPSRIRLVREADVRYAGQSMEVRVAAPSGPVDGAFVAGLIDAFHAAHRKTFGYNYDGEQKVELVNFCVSGFGVIDRPSIPKLDLGTEVAPTPDSRLVYFNGAFRETPIYQRTLLPAGFRLNGPAVIEEFGSTTVVFPGQSLAVDEHGTLIVRPACVAEAAP